MEELFAAIDAKDLDAVRELVTAKPGLAAQADSDDRTPLHAAAAKDAVEIAAYLLDAGAPMNARTDEGRTALHDAIEHGGDRVRDLLLSRGAEVDICSAAILGRVDEVREMLARDPALANDRSTELSPLGWAAFGNQTEVAKVLLDAGARMDDGELHCAASVGHVEVGRLLIERGVDPNALNESGATALHAAATMRYTSDSSEFVRMLLEKGADPTIGTLAKRTALDIAKTRLEQQNRAKELGQQVSEKAYDKVVDLLTPAAAAAEG